ncbi:hypothetical protein CUU_3190 [Phocaeicola vulgatus PC510]|uniref:Uncharacterized protein n=2 Tax=Phocaeicola vulgatus TaxID=821 RepID=A0A078R6S7_PHOVU|nr:hypothetical protein CUU_3190 [Phocaeicola vulgatus PC510]KDS27093.1 hypothetical protein M098_1916 [Phocaeicola vulgatus str. 3775 SR(B) 19]KDS31050.1 hypothetical protein M097_2248 [Phocaeicola vulgatus str. 3775 SL(B) 10 (iv)]
MNIYLANKKYTKNKSEKMYFAIFAACFGSIKHILFRKLRYDNERRCSTKEEV